MFTNFFLELRQAKVPVSIKEYLALMEGMAEHVAEYSIDDFYYLSRAILVKDERNLDKFDKVFGHAFKGLEAPAGEGAIAEIPEEWLRKLAEKLLTDEEKAQIEAMGGWEKLMETLKKRLEEQQKRHQGGSKWIGTAGTSPFGAYGFNPEGVRIGQDKNREGREVELDMPDTIRSTARNAGYLDIKMIPERRNKVKLLLLFDIGGSMDAHIRVCEELFSAARTEFKHLEFFYFHNCLYEKLWKDNRRRHVDTYQTAQLLNTFPPDYKIIFVGDASMSPYEIAYPGGSVEHWNEEAGQVWVQRMCDTYRSVVWLNPVPERHWSYTPSIQLLQQLSSNRMFPLTLGGLDSAMKELNK